MSFKNCGNSQSQAENESSNETIYLSLFSSQNTLIPTQESRYFTAETPQNTQEYEKEAENKIFSQDSYKSFNKIERNCC